jgi:hypothetical protein
LGLSEVGNQAKPLKYSEKKKVVFRTHLEQMFKRSTTDLNKQPTTTQQRLAFELKNVSLLPDGCRCINDKRETRYFSESTSDRHLQASLDWTGRANGLAS